MSPRTLQQAFNYLLLTIVLAGTAAAQREGYVEVPMRGTIPSHRFECSIGTVAFTDAASLNTALTDKNCPMPFNELWTDQSRQVVVHYAIGSDCHMRVAIKVYRVDAERKYKVIINNIYGGCRAGGGRQGWIVFEKPEQEYGVEIDEVKVDRIHRGHTGEFLFPKPPSTIVREVIETRELDLDGCLPTSGQSRWVIRTDEQLQRAIGKDPAEAGRCREYLKSLAINFDTHTLAQYSFASGHCQRPPGITLETVKETSSDPAENRYVLKVSYDNAGANYCKVWTTYPIWVLVPKLASGYQFAFESGARKI